MDLTKKIRKIFFTIGYKTKPCNFKVDDIISLALNETRYYSELNLKDANILSFPFLTKEIIREKFEDLLVKNARSRKGFFINTSGGSTGEPVKIAQDFEYVAINRFYEIKQLRELGWNPGDNIVKFWGDEREIIKGYKSFRRLAVEVLKGEYIFNTFVLTPHKIKKFLENLKVLNPSIIIGYVSSLYEIAKFILENGLKVYSPKAIISSAGVLYDEIRDIIKDAFRCRVYNKYGSREVGMIAYENEESYRKFMWITEMNYLEVIDGRIIVTSLANKVMPLIRYEIGDLGEICEYNGNKTLRKVIGRTVEVFKNRDGKIIDGEFFTHLLYFKPGIRRFQFIQEDYDFIKVKIEPDETWYNKYLGELNKIVIPAIKKVMGDKINIQIELVEKIPPLKSGKFIYTISNVK